MVLTRSIDIFTCIISYLISPDRTSNVSPLLRMHAIMKVESRKMAEHN